MKYLPLFIQVRRYKKIIRKSSHFSRITLDELKQLLKNGGGQYLLVGKPTCLMCRSFTPHLSQVLDEKKTLTVSYFDTDNYTPDEYMPLFEQVGIKYLPSLYLLNGKYEFERMNVYSPQSAIKLWINTTQKQ